MSETFYDLPKYPVTVDMWDNIKRESRPIVVYGMGNGGDKLVKRLSLYGVTVSDFFASDGFVRGQLFHGKRVLSFAQIREKYKDFVVLVSFGSSREEVIELIEKLSREVDMYLPDMPVADEEEYFDKDFYNKNYESILTAYGALADDTSREIFSSVIHYKLSGRLNFLLSKCVNTDEIYSLLPYDRIFSLVDAGAYNGDTVRDAIKYFPNLKTVYAVEPDVKTYKRLLKYINTVEYPCVKPINAAVWSESREGSFISSGNRNSSVNSTASFEHKETPIPLITVDSLSVATDYIKYDVEGAEFEALIGSHNTIENYRPALLVSAYHRSRDIFSLVNYLSDKYPFYNVYVRRTKCLPAWELNLILVNKA